jgi:hypothetical protein
VIDLDFHADLSITPGDVDWFTFTLTTSVTLVADVGTHEFSSTLDTMLGLFDASGDLMGSSDDHGGSYDPRIETHLGTGTYYLAVNGYPGFSFRGDHAQGGSYSLSVTATRSATLCPSRRATAAAPPI